MSSDSTKAEGLIMKLLFGIGIAVFLNWKFPVKSLSTNEAVLSALTVFAALYIVLSIIIVMHHICGNYILSVILAIVALCAIGKAVDSKLKISAANSYYVALALGLLLALFDIVRVIHYFWTKHKLVKLSLYETAAHSDTNDFRQHIKEDPQMFLTMANTLEQKLGRKPSSEEVMDYIDSVEIEDHGLADELASAKYPS